MAGVKDSIKKVFSSSAPLKSKWDSQTQVNIYALDTFLRKAGYVLVDIEPHKVSGKISPELIIEPVKRWYMTPDITHDITEGTFTVETYSFGEITTSDLEELIKGYENALGVLHHLEKLDLSKLEIQ